MSKSIPIYASGSDIAILLAALERQRSILYTVAGSFPTSTPQVFHSVTDLVSLGVSHVGDQAREPAYLITDKDVQVVPRVIQQQNGGVRYSFDQELNPASIVVRPGGLYEGKCLIAGQFGTCSTDVRSLDLMKLVSKELKKRFAKVKAYFVGVEAGRFLDDGYRLTPIVKSSADYDLRRD